MKSNTRKAAGKANLDPLVRFAMSMYTGEKCQGCGKTFDTVESLRDSVWWPWKEGRVGHKACYEKANAPDQARLQPSPEAGCSVVHRCPLMGRATMSCCGKTPFEVPRTDRMTTDYRRVTCKPNAKAEVLR